MMAVSGDRADASKPDLSHDGSARPACMEPLCDTGMPPGWAQ